MNDIELLKRDICARLPFGVYCEMGNKKSKIEETLHTGGLDMLLDDRWTVKPYLFRMSDMLTEVTLRGKKVKMIDRILDILNLDGYCGIYTSWEHDTDDLKFIIVKTWGEPTYRLDLETFIVYKYGEYEKIEPTSWTYYLSIYNLLLENFFDVNGLIPKGLAYAVSGNKNPYKEKEG